MALVALVGVLGVALVGVLGVVLAGALVALGGVLGVALVALAGALVSAGLAATFLDCAFAREAARYGLKENLVPSFIAFRSPAR